MIYPFPFVKDQAALEMNYKIKKTISIKEATYFDSHAHIHESTEWL